MHIKNIFEDGELQEKTVSKDSLLTAKDGKNYKTKFYNLDLIIAVGYRVKSVGGTQFRIWANKLIKEYDKYMRNHLTQAEKDYLEIMGEDIKKLK